MLLFKKREVGVSASGKIRREASFDCNHSRLENSQSRINLKRSVRREMYAITNPTEEKLGKQVCGRMWLSHLLSHQTFKKPTVKINWHHVNSQSKDT